MGMTALRLVIYAMMERESKFNPAPANTPKGGIMQIIKPGRDQVRDCFGFDLKDKDIGSIEPNIHAGILLLRHYLCKHGGDITKAVAAYNGGGDKQYLSHIADTLIHYSTDTDLVAKFRNKQSFVVECTGCAKDWLKGESLDTLAVSKAEVKRGEVFTVTWTGKNTFDVDVFQIVLRVRRAGAKESTAREVTVAVLPKKSSVTRSFKYEFGADTKEGAHEFWATARPLAPSCGGEPRAKLKASVTLTEQKKTVPVKRADGVIQHYSVSDENPKYAQSVFGVPLTSGWVV